MISRPSPDVHKPLQRRLLLRDRLLPVLAKQVVHRLDQHQLSRPPLLDGEDAELLMRLHVDEGGFERASTLTINALAQPLARLETKPVPGRNRHRRPSPGVPGDIRARRNRSEKLPKPRISIRPPLARRAAICSNINRTASVTSRSTSWGCLCAMRRISSDCVIGPFLHSRALWGRSAVQTIQGSHEVVDARGSCRP